MTNLSTFLNNFIIPLSVFYFAIFSIGIIEDRLKNVRECVIPCTKCGRRGTIEDIRKHGRIGRFEDFGRCKDVRKCHTRCFGNIDLCKPKYVVQNEWKYLRREIWKCYYKKN